MKRFVFTLFAAITLVAAVTGCRHTAEGAGKDIERAGEKIQDKVN